ncbi:hypothetical protein N6L24_07980 [Cognatishimia sp. SS12]|nr:hypothetical protein [Cognatishimia sp. SS12]
MKTFLMRFIDRESGAVTVDWVVLSAGTITLVLAVMGSVQTETAELTSDAATVIQQQDPAREIPEANGS